MWDHSVFSKNPDRLLEHEVVEAFFAEVMKRADEAELLSQEHFSVDGTLIQAWASHKSLKFSCERRRPYVDARRPTLDPVVPTSWPSRGPASGPEGTILAIRSVSEPLSRRLSPEDSGGSTLPDVGYGGSAPALLSRAA